MADNEVNVNIRGDARQFIKATKEATAAANEMGSKTQEAMGAANKAADKLSSEIQQVGAAADQAAPKVAKLGSEAAKTGTQAANSSSAWGSLRTATTAYLASIVTNPLAQVGAALVAINRAIGEVTSSERAAAALMGAFASDQNITNLERTNSLIGQLSSRSSFFGDDAITDGAAVLKNLGATQRQIESLLPAATDLAAVYGTSVTEAARKLANGIIGDTKALRDFGINLKSGATTAERYAAILERQGRAAEELTLLDDGLSGAMGRLGKATNDAFGQAGSSFQNFLSGGLTVLTKMIQAIALIPPAIELVANSIVGIIGDVTIQLEGVREAFFNLFTGKGFNAPNADRFFDAWRKQTAQTMDKASGELGKRWMALTGQDISKPVSIKVPETNTGLIAPPKELKEAKAPPIPPTLTEQALSLAKVKEAFGVAPASAITEAATEIIRSIGLYNPKNLTGFTSQSVLQANQGRQFTTDEMNLLGLLQGGLLETQQSTNQAIVEGMIATANEIADPIARLESLIRASDIGIGFAKAEQGMAFTGPQKEAANQQVQEELNKRKQLGIELVKAQADRNAQFITAFTNAMQQFLQQFGDQIGRTIAGAGGAVKSSDAIRGVGGLASNVLGIAGSLMGPGALIGGAPAVAVLGTVGVAIAGLTSIFSGFLDGQEEQRNLLQNQKDIQYDSYDQLKQLNENMKASGISAKEALGLITPQQAKLQRIIESGLGQGQIGWSSLGQVVKKSMGGPGTEGFDKLKGLVTDYFTGPGQGGELPMRRLLSGALGVSEGDLGNYVGGTAEQTKLTGQILDFFAQMENFFKQQAQDQIDQEMKALGSTPRNPVYIWDITPQEERFTFQPRESFFRAAATRQFGRNEIVPASAMS